MNAIGRKPLYKRIPVNLSMEQFKKFILPQSESLADISRVCVEHRFAWQAQNAKREHPQPTRRVPETTGSKWRGPFRHPSLRAILS